MACTKQYLNLAGAGLCAAGGAVGIGASGIVAGVSAGTTTPLMIATAVASGLARVGSMLWAASGYMDLADCLEAAGRQADADRMRARSQALRADAERIQGELERLQALVV